MITLTIIIITSIISIMAFNNREMVVKYAFIPTIIKRHNQWYRFFSHGFIHANFSHLLFNMLTLYFFGDAVEQYFRAIWGRAGIFLYILLYISALAIASWNDYLKNQNNDFYIAVGASGAVSAVVFAFILFQPWAMLGVFFVIPMPAIVFAILYLLYCQYMSKRGGDNIAHNAHFWGSVYGFIFPIIFKFSLLLNFFYNLF